MRIVILNGSMEKAEGFNEKLALFTNKLTDNKEIKEVMTYSIKDMTINQCIGCFGCWVKKPGKCVLKDDMDQILKSVINSDLVIFASPLLMGMTTSVLKKATDRLIPLIHPYITLVDGECHHRKRYEQYPYIGVIYQADAEDEAEDIEGCHEIYKRLAINFHSHVKFFSPLDEIKVGDIL
jgi:multimeric flavodoxin WrbA